MTYTIHCSAEIDRLSLNQLLKAHELENKVLPLEDLNTPCMEFCVLQLSRDPSQMAKEERLALESQIKRHAHKPYVVCGTRFNPSRIRNLFGDTALWIEPADTTDEAVGERILGEFFTYGDPKPHHGMWGETLGMHELYRDIDVFAPYQGDSVLILGERGCGKELVAHGLHHAYLRTLGAKCDAEGAKGQKRREMVYINCAEFNGQVIEAELFGTQKGIYTGAVNRTGLLPAANGGSVFIDEIGKMELPFQAKLLRVVETGMVRPLGSNSLKKINSRLIFATNTDLDRAVAAGAFLPDLFDRIKNICLNLSPLRARRADIPLLVNAFCADFGRENKVPMVATREAVDVCFTFHWPGNIRELRSVIRLGCMRGRTGQIDTQTVRERVRELKRKNPTKPASKGLVNFGFSPREGLKVLERRFLQDYMKSVDDCRSEAEKPWQIAKISRSSWYEKKRQLSDRSDP